MNRILSHKKASQAISDLQKLSMARAQLSAGNTEATMDTVLSLIFGDREKEKFEKYRKKKRKSVS